MSAFDVHVLRPMALWLLLPFLGFLWHLWRTPAGLGDWTREIDPALLAAMAAMGMTDNNRSRVRLLLAALSLLTLIIALAGPAIPRRDAVSYRNIDGVIFVLDASKQTVESDDWQDMITLLRSSIDAMGTRPAALIVFGEDAYVALNLTYDLNDLGMTLSLIDAQTVPTSRAKIPPDPARGLKRAADLIVQGALLASDTVLITRIAPGPEAVAMAATMQNTRLSTITATPQEGAALAQVGGGAPLSFGDVGPLRNILGSTLHKRLEAQGVPLNFYADQGRWAILLALCLLFPLLTGRRKAP